ncbi:MAG TPA: alginate export family protein [Pseudolabrys sp.]|nr:alginate export family protein [Pseudolabrys sp.]
MPWRSESVAIARSTVALLLATLCVSVPGWSQSRPAVAPESHVSQPDGPEGTAEALTRPAFRLDRSEEDWSAFCLPTRRDDRWDPAKCLGPSEGPWFVSFGGELRSSYEIYRNYNWGSGFQDRNGYYLNRLMGHADLHLGARVRLFAEFQSGLEVGRTGGPRLFVDEDKLDVSQAFIELNPSTRRHRAPATLRIGRQEFTYGEGTLVSTRELNVRRPFDGVKVVFQPPKWRIDVFAAKPVATQKGAFDDASQEGATLWGAWAVTAAASPWINQLDLYYVGLDREAAQFDRGIANERRHTFGFDAHEQAGPLAFAQEGVLQLGTFGSGRLWAWKLAHQVFYSIPRLRRSVLGIQGAISSGDDPSSGELRTFHPLFPKGLYYGYMLFTSGSLNAIVAHPSLNVPLSSSVSLNVDSFFLWRQGIADGLYSQSGAFLRPAGPSLARYVGATQDVSIQWRLDAHTTVQFLAAYYEVGAYLRESNPPAKNAAFYSLTANYKF